MVIASLLAAALAATAPHGISIADIMGVTDLSGLSVSPDGRWVAFRTSRPALDSNDYRIGWFVVPVDRSQPARRIADGGGMLFDDSGAPEAQTPIWSPRSDAIYYRALINGQIQIWRAPVDGGGTTRISDEAGNVRDLALDPDGRSLVYRVGATRDALENAERRAHDEGVVVDKSVDLAQPVSRGGIVDGQPGSQRLLPGWFAHGDILWQAPLRTVHVQLPQASSRQQRPPSAVPGAIRIGDHQQLIIDRPGAPPLVCLTSQCANGRPMGAIALRQSKSLLVTTVDRALNETLSIWEPGNTKGRTVARVTGVLNGGRDPTSTCAPAIDSLVCVAAAATQPPRLVRVALRNGAQLPLFDPNEALRSRLTLKAQEMHWSTSDRTPLTGQLILPATRKPAKGFPLVLTYYACWEFLRGGVGDELPVLPLASRGVATLCINRARSPNGAVEAKPWDYDHAMDGIEAIVDRLQAQGMIDRSRVGIWGLSFGSEIAMTASWRLPWLAAAAVATGTLDSDFYWFNSVAGRNTPEMMRSNWDVGDPDSDPNGWTRISPARHAGDIHLPLLMQLPEQEARWSMELYTKLSRSRTPVEMVAFANEPHVKNQPRHKAAAYARNLDWFLYWLEGEEDPSPAKAAQYARWDALSARWERNPEVAHVASP